MVQTYTSPIRVYKFPFELVMAAYEKRFPTCKMIPVFVGSEITSEVNSPDGATSVIERRCKLNVDAPYLLRKIAGVDFVYFIQRNSKDRRRRTLLIEAWNESFSSRLTIKETCKYSVHPDNEDWTCFEQDASLEIKSFFGFESAVEKLAIKQYMANIKKGKEVIDYYIQELLDEGVTHVPRFSIEEDVGNTGDADDEITIVNSQITAPVNPPASFDGKLHRDSLYKLEADYIHRCLGDLDPVEESRLVELKQWLQEHHKEKIPSDAHLLRFLRARGFIVEKGREMLCRSLIWRKQHQIDRLLSTWKAPEVLKQYFPGGWHGYDDAGRPVFVLRLGNLDVKGLLRSVGVDGLLKLAITVCEEGLARCEEATKLHQHPVSSWACIFDLDGLSMRHLWRPGLKVLYRIIEVVEANYPETMGRVFLVRAPRLFPILWTIVSPFIDENTRKKFIIYGGNDHEIEGGLKDYLDKKYIPKFLGGDADCDVPEGGLVPKSHYLPEDADLESGIDSISISSESLYQSVSLVKDSYHEVPVVIQESGSVITWDFDVCKGDCTFTILYTPDPLPPMAVPPPSPAAHPSLMDSHPGLQLTRVVPVINCTDGSSEQGTYAAEKPGTYILQWKSIEPASTSAQAHSQFTFDFGLTSSYKCKVLYHYDTISQDEFRGSLSSVQSFSSLSMA
ncbi:SEC14-like protein 1 [Paramacrobiotus metropolitanus]|uniref:SEC14-like protein 1 n=1 Tax=Paramacrobiotus metropolitanus TaxID=2943436 RepID=UPI0024464E2D|nr:SEC14-like protein 1 [Paramacrobiotus metropolitanus]XP_055353784.1 SEC14-like protein 1 [Paramacrobiotus metropolitanus]XP_055353785.1 SEC14-like protein 1 [Paramacrobiotus metropolitanus]XP_055353786.1 SEC14-like protein 1 [Paramacrobiotus metropolitanus]XP_055353787.1 SEC14-like protein 1 [Paramacrobiotus metropolitanus]